MLDTHIWIWWLLGDTRLSKESRDQLGNLPPEERHYLCDISICECGMLVELGRLQLDCTLADFLKIGTSPATVKFVSISSAIVLEMNQLPESFHRDPADRLILSTAKALRTKTGDQRFIARRFRLSGNMALISTQLTTSLMLS